MATLREAKIPYTVMANKPGLKLRIISGIHITEELFAASHKQFVQKSGSESL